MEIGYLGLVLVYLSRVSYVHSNLAKPKGTKLIFFLMDGIRWDYLERQELPGFTKLMNGGVRADYLIPDFPTMSYPNYYSIMTGLHVESHGMVGNYMFDPVEKATFIMDSDTSSEIWWNGGEPIWVTAEKQGKHVHMYYWPGCDLEILGVNVTFCEPFNPKIYPKVPQLRVAINDTLAKFQNGTADVAGIYISQPDDEGHRYGPNSTEVKEAMSSIDQEMSRLLDELKAHGLHDEVNVMIFSDHGMAEIDESRVVNITKVLDPDDIAVNMDVGPITHIWPKPGKLEKIYYDLLNMNNTHMMVFKKEHLPDRWFFKNHYRVGPIVVVAKNGWYIAPPIYPYYYSYPDTGPSRGMHGYDNQEADMRTVFLAYGPGINKNKKVPAFANVNIYQMMCKLLDINASKNNGSWSAVEGIILLDDATTDPKFPESGAVLWTTTMLQCMLALAFILSII